MQLATILTFPRAPQRREPPLTEPGLEIRIIKEPPRSTHKPFLQEPSMNSFLVIIRYPMNHQFKI